MIKVSASICLTFSIAFLGGCYNAPHSAKKQNNPASPIQMSSKQIDTAPPIKFKELPGYRNGDQFWQSIVIPQNLEKDKLIALALYLRRSSPTTSFHIFDNYNEKEYRKFMESNLHYKDDSLPYPEAWLKKHYVAIINKMVSGRGARWQLYAMDAGMKYAVDDVVIVDLEL